MTRASLLSTLPVLTLLAAAPDTAAGQAWERWAVEADVGPFLSGQPTLERGSALNVRVLMRADNPEWLRVGLTVAQMWSGSERDGEACRQYNPIKAGCTLERLAEEVRVRSYGVAVFREFGLTWSLRTRAGVGLSINELNATSRGMTTGHPGDLYVARSAHFGGLVEGALLWTPTDHLPLDLMVSGASRIIWFDGCRDGPLYFAPYCGASALRELRVGVAYRLGL